MVWFSGHEACVISAPQPGIELSFPALEGEVLTTGPPGKSQITVLIKYDTLISRRMSYTIYL